MDGGKEEQTRGSKAPLIAGGGVLLLLLLAGGAGVGLWQSGVLGGEEGEHGLAGGRDKVQGGRNTLLVKDSDATAAKGAEEGAEGGEEGARAGGRTIKVVTPLPSPPNSTVRVVQTTEPTAVESTVGTVSLGSEVSVVTPGAGLPQPPHSWGTQPQPSSTQVGKHSGSEAYKKGSKYVCIMVIQVSIFESCSYSHAL